MIKICYVIGQLAKGGAERQLYELVKGINKNIFEPIVISLSQDGYWIKEIERLHIQVIELQRKTNKEFARLFKLIQLFKTLKPNIVHSYAFSANSYSRIAGYFAKVPVIIASERNAAEIGTDKGKYQLFIDKLLALISHGIICNSYKASESLVKKYAYNSKKVFTVHNGINIEQFLLESNLNKEEKSTKKVIGTVCRLHPQKNITLFLDMAKIILEKYPYLKLKFIIIGEGVLRAESEKYSQHLDIVSEIKFYGERDDIPALLQTLDIYVMTSLYEGLSNAIMEAMLAGLPVVVTDVGGNSELVINGETGFLCPLNNANMLADKVTKLINNKSMANQMGKCGKKRIIDEFGVDKMIQKTEGIYMKFLKKSSSRQSRYL